MQRLHGVGGSQSSRRAAEGVRAVSQQSEGTVRVVDALSECRAAGGDGRVVVEVGGVQETVSMFVKGRRRQRNAKLTSFHKCR
jgi:hypothetical protein